MKAAMASRTFTLLQREFREHRRAFFWVPLGVALVLAVGMLISVLVIDRISVFGDTLIDVIEKQGTGDEVVISIGARIGDEAGEPPAPAEPPPPVSPGPELPESAWDFGRDWQFSPRSPRESAGEAASEADDVEVVRGLNPLLNVLHNILILVLLIAIAQYLLGALFDDRRDRSILFWRSLPVSEWHSVLSKFAFALLAAPAIVMAISIVLQVVTTLVAALLVWRLDLSVTSVIVNHLSPGRLLVDQIGGWLLSSLWLAPTCAWLLLASAAARRSPFLLAVLPVIGLALVETLFLDSSYVMRAVGRHLPHLGDDRQGVGFFLFGPSWSSIDWASLLSGLVFAALALGLAVWLRRHRWEL
jgi:hypothetical protein